MARPLDKYFGVSVSFNEILERWVAIDNREQEVIGYGMTSMEALADYFNKRSGDDETSSDDNNLF